MLRLLLLLATSTPALAGAMQLEKLADGVYAVLQTPQERFDDANSVLIVSDKEVVVIDAQARPENVEAVIGLIRELTAAPVTTVINTHWHADHVQGNAAYRRHFGEDVEFIGHRTLLEDVPARAEADVLERLKRYSAFVPEAEQALAKGQNRAGEPLSAEQITAQRDLVERTRRWVERNRDAQFLSPTRSYETNMPLQAGNIAMELRHCKAHTRGDTVVWLPRQKILVTGDLLDDLPYIGHGYPASWLDCLSELAELDAVLYVPGHGPVFRDSTKLQAISDFLQSLLQHVRDSKAAGATLQQATESYDAAPSRKALTRGDTEAGAFFDATLAEAIARTWQRHDDAGRD